MASDDPDDPLQKAEAVRAAETAAQRDAEAEEADRKKAGRDGGGDISPAHAELAANVRPDVISSPMGLETITTAKSATYRPDQEPAFREERDDATKPPVYSELIDTMAERFAGTRSGEIFEAMKEPPEAAILSNDPDAIDPTMLEDSDEWSRSAAADIPAGDDKPKVLTLEAIAADPWNAVELPLPENPDLRFLAVAQTAVEYSIAREAVLMDLEPEDAGHELRREEARARRKEIEFGLVHEYGPELTAENLAENPWLVLDGDIPNDASKETLEQAFIATRQIHDFAQMIAHEDGLEMTTEELGEEIAHQYFKSADPDLLTPTSESFASLMEETLEGDPRTRFVIVPGENWSRNPFGDDGRNTQIIEVVDEPEPEPEARSPVDYVASLLAKAKAFVAGDRVIESEIASLREQQQGESQSAEKSGDSGREGSKRGDYVDTLLAEAKAAAKERDAETPGREIEAGQENSTSHTGRDIF